MSRLDQQAREAAEAVSERIILSARLSGDDPIVWVTGNAYYPAWRSFGELEELWNKGEGALAAEAFYYAIELIENKLNAADVYIGAPDWDNSLFAVDTARFEYVEDSDGDDLQGEWRRIA